MPYFPGNTVCTDGDHEKTTPVWKNEAHATFASMSITLKERDRSIKLGFHGSDVRPSHWVVSSHKSTHLTKSNSRMHAQSKKEKNSRRLVYTEYYCTYCQIPWSFFVPNLVRLSPPLISFVTFFPFSTPSRIPRKQREDITSNDSIVGNGRLMV